MHGVNSRILLWIKVFLSDLSQATKVNGVKSDPEFVLTRIPQGSVLGLTLFVIYINGLSEAVRFIEQITTREDVLQQQSDINSLNDDPNDGCLLSIRKTTGT